MHDTHDDPSGACDRVSVSNNLPRARFRRDSLPHCDLGLLMKTATLVLLAIVVPLFADSHVCRLPAKPLPALEEPLLNPEFATLTMTALYERFRAPMSGQEAQAREYLREEMKKKGVNVSEDDGRGFLWMSSAKDSLRAEPGRLQLFGKAVGEVLVRANGDKVGPVTVSLFNRGDNGDITTDVLATRVAEWKSLIDQKLGVRSEPRVDRGAVNMQGWLWRKDRSAWLLEYSVGKATAREPARAEFLRLRIASLDSANNRPVQVVHRSSLADHVMLKDNGDVLVDGVPMVDQGQKGYCAVATVERLARYFGLEVDQHEMAEVANTGAMGTSGKDMEDALKKVTGRIHVKTTKQMDLDMRQFEQDVRSYNQEAKKAGKREFPYKRNERVVNPLAFWATVDPDVFCTIKEKQTGFTRFESKVREYADQGIPLCWAVQLGMFKEENLPQVQGGHMRLIIGYNKKTGEILYSDSWGKGHELKRMPAAHAWCMTMAVYTLAPTR